MREKSSKRSSGLEFETFCRTARNPLIQFNFIFPTAVSLVSATIAMDMAEDIFQN